MRPAYVTLASAAETFTAVFTPHFLERFTERSSKASHRENIAGPAHLLRAWAAASVLKAGATVGYAFGSGYVYCRRIYNNVRARWELEYISFTPSSSFHTHARNYAIRIEV